MQFKTFLEAAHFVLVQARRPLPAKRIVDDILAQGLCPRKGRRDTAFNSWYGTLIKAVDRGDKRFGRVERSDVFFAASKNSLGDIDGSETQGQSALMTEMITHGVLDSAFIPEGEGKERIRLHIEYERSSKNRAEAIRIHGTKCTACGFEFNERYGRQHARDFIEIHHIRSLTEQQGRPVDPATDLIPLCSNCHSMAHRQHGQIMALEELKLLLKGDA